MDMSRLLMKASNLAKPRESSSEFLKQLTKHFKLIPYPGQENLSRAFQSGCLGLIFSILFCRSIGVAYFSHDMVILSGDELYTLMIHSTPDLRDSRAAKAQIFYFGSRELDNGQLKINAHVHHIFRMAVLGKTSLAVFNKAFRNIIAVRYDNKSATMVEEWPELSFHIVKGVVDSNTNKYQPSSRYMATSISGSSKVTADSFSHDYDKVVPDFVVLLREDIIPLIIKNGLDMNANQLSIMAFTFLQSIGNHFGVASDIRLSDDKSSIDYIVFHAENKVLTRMYKESKESTILRISEHETTRPSVPKVIEFLPSKSYTITKRAIVTDIFLVKQTTGYDINLVPTMQNFDYSIFDSLHLSAYNHLEMVKYIEHMLGNMAYRNINVNYLFEWFFGQLLRSGLDRQTNKRTGDIFVIQSGLTTYSLIFAKDSHAIVIHLVSERKSQIVRNQRLSQSILHNEVCSHLSGYNLNLVRSIYIEVDYKNYSPDDMTDEFRNKNIILNEYLFSEYSEKYYKELLAYIPRDQSQNSRDINIATVTKLDRVEYEMFTNLANLQPDKINYGISTGIVELNVFRHGDFRFHHYSIKVFVTSLLLRDFEVLGASTLDSRLILVDIQKTHGWKYALYSIMDSKIEIDDRTRHKMQLTTSVVKKQLGLQENAELPSLFTLIEMGADKRRVLMDVPTCSIQ